MTYDVSKLQKCLGLSLIIPGWNFLFWITVVGYDMTGESGFSCKVILNTDRQPIGGSIGVGSGIGTIHNMLRQHLDFF